MNRSIPLLLAVMLHMSAHAQMSPDSPLVQALHNGRATTALPESQGAQLVAQKIQQQTKSQGDVTVAFVRVARFTSQPRCGRVGYALFQASSNTYWPQFGGQMNVCDDGTPPLRSCKGSTTLVPAESQCSDGTFPVDTPEIKAAIAKAVEGGSMTGEQFKAQFKPRPQQGEVAK
jgi:hypothetical protein